MHVSTLTVRTAQEIIDGGMPPGREDLDLLYAVMSYLRASGEYAPPPRMSAALIRQIELGTPPAN